MKFLTNFLAAQERIAKRQTLSVLRGMSEDQLRDVGISPELLAQGVRSWPWRAPEENWYPRTSIFAGSVNAPVGPVSVDTAVPQPKNDKTAA